MREACDPCQECVWGIDTGAHALPAASLTTSSVAGRVERWCGRISAMKVPESFTAQRPMMTYLLSYVGVVGVVGGVGGGGGGGGFGVLLIYLCFNRCHAYACMTEINAC